MKSWPSFAVGIIAGVLSGAAAIIHTKARRRKDQAEIERARRLALSKTGRITAGEIIGLVEPEGESAGPMLLVYHYEVSGVIYEVAQDISALAAVTASAPYVVGQNVMVKYDTKRPGNSIIAGEEWCGITGLIAQGQQAVRGTPIVDISSVKKT